MRINIQSSHQLKKCNSISTVMSPFGIIKISGTKPIEQMRNFYQISFLLILSVILIPYVTTAWDPYEVIGVKRDAGLDQIKRTYRDLARKLHPDKSDLDEGEAEKKFIELNKAFNILKDPEKRSRYDLHGETGENQHPRDRQANRQRRDHWAQRGGRTFTFYRTYDTNMRRKSMTAKQYHDYVKESKFRLFFVFFYSDFCPSCDVIDATWTKITEELAKFNIGSFAINVYHEPKLSHELGVSSIPHIACLIDGQIKPYHMSEISLKSFVQFTRGLLPHNLVPLLKTEAEQDRFITSGPQHNRLSAIIVQNGDTLKLRYLLMAYELRQYYRFAQISTKSSDYSLIASKYKLSIDPRSRKAHFLVLDENIRRPIINTQFDEDTYDFSQLRKQLTRWPFLQLPKLFSQQRFDDLCLHTIPKNGDLIKTRLCVILFATDTPSSLPVRNKLIEFIEANKFTRDDKVVFTYLDPLKQSEFVSSLISETKSAYPFENGKPIDMAVIMIERHADNPRKARYRWLGARWNPRNPDELDKVKVDIYQLVDSYKRNLEILRDKVALSLLYDEEGPSLMDRVFWRFFDNVMHVIYHLASPISFSTLIVLIICTLITSLFLYQFPVSLPAQAEPESMRRFTEQPKRETAANHREPSNGPNTRIYSEGELKIIELKAETYNGMIRLLKPGYRSIVLLVDNETKDILLPRFKKAVWPYRRNKTLLFGYMCLDKNLAWYKSLLEEVLSVNGLNVNKKYCIGTVLSLNGFKKYFRVYHAKHHEIDYYDNETDNDGSFLGFSEENEDPNDDELDRDLERNRTFNQTTCTVDRLLDRLPIWLDKMFDGLTKRYFVDSWPEEMK